MQRQESPGRYAKSTPVKDGSLTMCFKLDPSTQTKTDSESLSRLVSLRVTYGITWDHIGC